MRPPGEVIDDIDTFEAGVESIDVTDVCDMAKLRRWFQALFGDLSVDLLFKEKDLRFVVIDDSDFRRVLPDDLSHQFATNRTATASDENCFAGEKCHVRILSRPM